MARDGTYRGGRRPRAGERPAPLAEKIAIWRVFFMGLLILLWMNFPQ